MNKFILVLLSFLFANLSRAQAANAFSEDFEKREYQKAADDMPFDTIGLLVAATETSNEEIERCRNFIDKWCNELKQKLGKAKGKKLLQRIFQLTEKEKLREYSDKASFFDIYQRGAFNFYTASAFYGIILSRFGISYKIVKNPQVCSVVAEKDGAMFVSGIIPREAGWIVYPEDTRLKIVQMLKDRGDISDNSSESEYANVLFQKYVANTKEITFKENIAWIYNYYGFWNYREDNVLGYYKWATKANGLSDDIEHAFAIRSTLTIMAFGSDVSQKQPPSFTIPEFAKYIQYVGESDMKALYHNYCYEEIIKNGKNLVLDSTNLKLKKLLSDRKELYETLLMDYYQMRGTYFFEKEDYYNACKVSLSQFLLDNKDLQIRVRLKGMLAEIVQSGKCHGDSIVALMSNIRDTARVNYLVSFNDFLVEAIRVRTQRRLDEESTDHDTLMADYRLLSKILSYKDYHTTDKKSALILYTNFMKLFRRNGMREQCKAAMLLAKEYEIDDRLKYMGCD